MELFSLTGLSPSLVGRSRAVLLTIQFVTSYKFFTPTTTCVGVKNSNVLSLLPSLLTSKLINKKFRLFRFRSPLLTESVRFIFLWLLECFTSPGALPNVLTRSDNVGLLHWVPPFGNLRIKAR